MLLLVESAGPRPGRRPPAPQIRGRPAPSGRAMSTRNEGVAPACAARTQTSGPAEEREHVGNVAPPRCGAACGCRATSPSRTGRCCSRRWPTAPRPSPGCPAARTSPTPGRRRGPRRRRRGRRRRVRAGRQGALGAPDGVVDVGNSAPACAFAHGGRRRPCRHDPFRRGRSIRRRPMDRVAVPPAPWATVDGRGPVQLPWPSPAGPCTDRLRAAGGQRPGQGAVLLAGLAADGETVVRATRHRAEAAGRLRVPTWTSTGAGTTSCGPPAAGTPDRHGRGRSRRPEARRVLDRRRLPRSRAATSPSRASTSAPPATASSTCSPALGADVEGQGHRRRAGPPRRSGAPTCCRGDPGLVDEVPILAVAAAAADGPTRSSGRGAARVRSRTASPRWPRSSGPSGQVEPCPTSWSWPAAGGPTRPGDVATVTTASPWRAPSPRSRRRGRDRGRGLGGRGHQLPGFRGRPRNADRS